MTITTIWSAPAPGRHVSFVAEAIGKWASLSTQGAESTGLYFDKFKPNVAYVNVQHPDSRVDRTIMITAPCPKTKNDNGEHYGHGKD